jgi:hypothetical protein
VAALEQSRGGGPPPAPTAADARELVAETYLAARLKDEPKGSRLSVDKIVDLLLPIEQQGLADAGTVDKVAHKFAGKLVDDANTILVDAAEHGIDKLIAGPEQKSAGQSASQWQTQICSLTPPKSATVAGPAGPVKPGGSHHRGRRLCPGVPQK